MVQIKKSSLVLIVLGTVCVAAALLLFLYNMWDDARAGIQVNEEKERLIAVVLPQSSAVRISPEKQAAEEEELTEEEVYLEMPVKEMDGVEYAAVLSIPSLSLELPVRNEWSYSGLQSSPCRYTGSAFMNDLVICAHNYSQHFGRLKDLEIGSDVLLVDMEGNLFQYRVALIETIMPTDVEKMTDSEYDLSLFTCTLGGQTRVTVRCLRVIE